MINFKGGQFEMNAAEFSDLRAFVDGRGYYHPSPFQALFKNSLQANTLHAFNSLAF